METATYYSMLRILSDIADVLGYPNEKEFYFSESERIKDCFRKKFISEGGLTVPESMTALACIIFNGLDTDDTFTAALADIINSNGGIADFGFHGAKYVIHSLINREMHSLAYKIATNRKYPGWGYMIDNGATTLWENWEGDLSQNHHALSDINSFFYKSLAGIRVDPKNPGFKHFFLKPYAPDDLDYVKAIHLSPYGKIESAWTKTDSGIKYTCTIPVGTTATLTLFDGDEKTLGSGNYEFFTKNK